MSDLFAVFGVNWKLLFIQGLNFGLLLAVLTYLLYKPIFRVITERQQKIAEGVKTAEAASKKLEDATGQSKSIVGEAVREAERLVADARAHADLRGDEIIHAAEARAAAALKDARMKAEETERQALEDSQREIARAAMLAAEKILKATSH
ncbi:MAG: F0F1 ATP synthase subunit B [bacterium]|nr:F0F1 ATP synthase subunit B [bacterium]